jgi:hypothetical protein
LNGQIVDNIFDIDTIKNLKQLKNNINGQIDNKRGRIIRPISNIDLLPQEVITILTNKASELYGKNLKLYAAAFGQYSKKFGYPKLIPHIDEVPSQFTIDYQLDGNIDWSIVIEGSEYWLKNNSILTFEGENVLHWRPKKEFSDNDFLDLIWFQFIDDDHWSYKTDARPDFKEYRKNFREKMNRWEGVYNAI